MCTYVCTHRGCMAPEIWCATDGQTDEQMSRLLEKVTYRGGYHTQK